MKYCVYIRRLTSICRTLWHILMSPESSLPKLKNKIEKYIENEMEQKKKSQHRNMLPGLERT